MGNSGAVQSSTLTLSASNGLAFNPGIGTFTLGALAGAYGFALADTNNGAVVLSVGGNGASTTFSGALGGNGSLLKAGTGTWTMTGTDTYSGGTTVNAGTLVLNAALSTGAVTVQQGGTLSSMAASLLPSQSRTVAV